MSEQTIQPMGIPELIHYKGWTIWGWTGWKGEKTTVLPYRYIDGKRDDHILCPKCQQSFESGQEIWVNYATTPQHWTCHYPDNRLDRLVAQWTAVKFGPNPAQNRYIQSSAGAGEGATGEYRKGECFDIGTDPIITELSSGHDKEQEKQAAYRRLRLLIDRLEGF